MASIDGVITGLDTTSIIEQLLAAERIPQNQLVVQKTTAEAKASVFADLRGRYDAVRTAAQKLDIPEEWARLAATSSDDLVAVSAGNGSITGAVTFSVVQRASAASVYSTDTVSSLDALIAPGGGFLTRSTITSGSGSLPGPVVPQASSPEPGSITKYPSDRRVSRLR